MNTVKKKKRKKRDKNNFEINKNKKKVTTTLTKNRLKRMDTERCVWWGDRGGVKGTRRDVMGEGGRRVKGKEEGCNGGKEDWGVGFGMHGQV